MNEKDVRYKADVSVADTGERDDREPRAQSGAEKRRKCRGLVGLLVCHSSQLVSKVHAS